MIPQQIVTESRQKTEDHLYPPLVRESECDVVSQHSLCSLMQPLFIGDDGASRSTPFEEGGDDEDIPDQAKDPGGEAEPQDQAKDPGEGAEAKTKKIPASGHGTTAPGSGTTVEGTVLPPWAAVLPCHGTTARTTAPYYRRRTKTFTVVGHGTTAPR